MAFQIDTANYIHLDGARTPYQVSQSQKKGVGTFVHKNGKRLKMPRKQYSLTSNSPASGIAGMDAFERDFRNAITPKKKAPKRKRAAVKPKYVIVMTGDGVFYFQMFTLKGVEGTDIPSLAKKFDTLEAAREIAAFIRKSYSTGSYTVTVKKL